MWARCVFTILRVKIRYEAYGVHSQVIFNIKCESKDKQQFVMFKMFLTIYYHKTTSKEAKGYCQLKRYRIRSIAYRLLMRICCLATWFGAWSSQF